MSSRRHRRCRFKITKDDLTLFAIMCLIALAVGAGIALIDEKSRTILNSFKQSAVMEIKQQVELYKTQELEKIKRERKSGKPN